MGKIVILVLKNIFILHYTLIKKIFTWNQFGCYNVYLLILMQPEIQRRQIASKVCGYPRVSTILPYF